MRPHAPGGANFSTKNFSLSITFQGKTYAICDKKQWESLCDRVREKVVSELSQESLQKQADARKAALQSGKPPPPMEPLFSEEEVEARVAQSLEEAGYARLQDILDRMTPEERDQWKTSYRFTPFSTKPGAQQ
jgi:hypothetical protein